MLVAQRLAHVPSMHHVVVHVAKRKPVLVFNKLCGTIKIDRSSTFIDSDFYLMDNKAK